MKAKSLSLALLLLAGAASSAFAQEREWRGGRGNLGSRPAPEAAQAGRAPEARPAPEARSPRSQPPHTAATIGQPRRRELPSAEAARRDWNRGDDGRREWRQRPAGGPDLVRPDADGRDRRWGVTRTPPARPGADGRDRGGDRVRVDRDRDWERDRHVQPDRNRDRNRNWDSNRNWDGNRDRDWSRDRQADRDRNWDRDRRVRPDRWPMWQRGRYPTAYNAHVRYRGHVWRQPPGYYVHSWRYGEYLPVGWYAQSYWLVDWWAYDLPEPPYGYEWVRVGADAVLVDTFSGQIVQVVRLLFW